MSSKKEHYNLSPQEPLAYTNLSRVYQKMGMIPEAEEAMAVSRQLSSGMF